MRERERWSSGRENGNVLTADVSLITMKGTNASASLRSTGSTHGVCACIGACVRVWLCVATNVFVHMH